MKVAQVEVISQAFFAAEELSISQWHKSLHADHAFFDSYYIDPRIKLSMAVSTDQFLFFHEDS